MNLPVQTKRLIRKRPAYTPGAKLQRLATLCAHKHSRRRVNLQASASFFAANVVVDDDEREREKSRAFLRSGRQAFSESSGPPHRTAHFVVLGF